MQGRCLGPLDPCLSFCAVHMGCGAAVALPAAPVGCSGLWWHRQEQTAGPAGDSHTCQYCIEMTQISFFIKWMKFSFLIFLHLLT